MIFRIAYTGRMRRLSTLLLCVWLGLAALAPTIACAMESWHAGADHGAVDPTANGSDHGTGHGTDNNCCPGGTTPCDDPSSTEAQINCCSAPAQLDVAVAGERKRAAAPVAPDDSHGLPGPTSPPFDGGAGYDTRTRSHATGFIAILDRHGAARLWLQTARLRL